MDPELEPPLEESSIEAMFRPPVQENFIVPPTLGDAVKGKTVLAKNLPKQTDIDRLMRVLNRKILHRSRFPESLKVVYSKISMNILNLIDCLQTTSKQNKFKLIH